MSNYIRKVKYNNHPSLGNLELDFCKDDKPFNTIVFAGENGCGKTTILETLSDFLNLGRIEPFSKISYAINNEIFSNIPYGSQVATGFHIRIIEDTGAEVQIESGRNLNLTQIEKDIYDMRHYGCAYSKARSGFKTQGITTVKTLELDKNKYENDSSDDFTSLKQLLVDIYQQDSNEWIKLCRNESKKNNQESIEKFDRESRISRFKQAFEKFFDNKITLDDITIEDNQYQIMFKKHGKHIPLDSLSTGEKQIVFRGAMLLKNNSILDGGFVFIDEPELSMHPMWQKEILKFYRNLFTKDGEQTVQMFFATHSEYVIKSAVEDKENVLIVSLHDSDGTINAKNMSLPTALPSIKSSEINYHVFGVSAIEYHIDLYGYLQNKLGLDTIRKADNYIKKSPLYQKTSHYKRYVKPGTLKNTIYQTLPTYIRNCIDHPDRRTYTPKEMSTSINLLEQLCR